MNRFAARRSMAPLVLVSLLFLLGGCPPPPVARPYPAPTASELMAKIAAHARQIHSLRAEARVEHTAEGGQRVKVTVRMLVERGGKLRLEAEAPLVGPVATLVSDGEHFALLDLRNHRFFEGPASACNVASLIRIQLAPEDVVSVLMGGAPIEGAPSGVSWDPSHGGREVLELRAPDGGSERIWLDARDRIWDLLAAERRDAAGQLRWRVEHEDFQDRGGGVRLPTRTQVEEPPEKADARLKFRSLEPNVAADPAVFHLEPPPGVVPEPARCN
jgi:hypothetical protein